MRFIPKLLISFLLSILIFSVSASAEEYSTDINDYPLVQDGNFVISYSSSSQGYFLLLTEDGNYFTTQQNTSGSCKIGCTGSYLCFILQNNKWVSYSINNSRTYKPLIANCNIYTDDTLTDIFFSQTVPDDPYSTDTDSLTDTDTVTDTESEAVETPSDFDFDNTLTAQKICKFIDTFSSLFRFLFVFFLMLLLYKFFNIFF